MGLLDWLRGTNTRQADDHALTGGGYSFFIGATSSLPHTTGLAELGDGPIVYVEAASENAGSVARSLHGMRLNGVFGHASAILVGRTYAPDTDELTQHDAVLDAPIAQSSTRAP